MSGSTPNSPWRLRGCAGGVEITYGTIIVAVAAAAALALNQIGAEVRFARRVFAGLATGTQSVHNVVDWEHLQAAGGDVGATYRELPGLPEQAAYRQTFIQSFAEGFRKEQGRLEAFTDWRQHGDGVVAADYPAKGKTLLLRISKRGSQRLLSGMEFAP